MTKAAKLTQTEGNWLNMNGNPTGEWRTPQEIQLTNLFAYFVRRAEENRRQAQVYAALSPDERWHAAKADTYQRCADKLKEVIF